MRKPLHEDRLLSMAASYMRTGSDDAYGPFTAPFAGSLRVTSYSLMMKGKNKSTRRYPWGIQRSPHTSSHISPEGRVLWTNSNPKSLKLAILFMIAAK